MKTVILEMRSLKETLAHATRAIETGRAENEARIGFATQELLWEVEFLLQAAQTTAALLNHGIVREADHQ